MFGAAGRRVTVGRIRPRRVDRIPGACDRSSAVGSTSMSAPRKAVREVAIRSSCATSPRSTSKMVREARDLLVRKRLSRRARPPLRRGRRCHPQRSRLGRALPSTPSLPTEVKGTLPFFLQTPRDVYGTRPCGPFSAEAPRTAPLGQKNRSPEPCGNPEPGRKRGVSPFPTNGKRWRRAFASSRRRTRRARRAS